MRPALKFANTYGPILEWKNKQILTAKSYKNHSFCELIPNSKTQLFRHVTHNFRQMMGITGVSKECRSQQLDFWWFYWYLDIESLLFMWRMRFRKNFFPVSLYLFPIVWSFVSVTSKIVSSIDSNICLQDILAVLILFTHPRFDYLFVAWAKSLYFYDIKGWMSCQFFFAFFLKIKDDHQKELWVISKKCLWRWNMILHKGIMKQTWRKRPLLS
jgi:hypothetical protein